MVQSALPTGTVTFLYTDIEGSTRRWEQHPHAMKAAIERHDAVMREAIEAHGGCIFRTMGDAFCASFSLASGALAAALDAQGALHAERWPPEVAPIRARVALHTGMGEVRDGDYVGTHLNRLARLLSTGYGGQTLISQATCELIRDSLPVGVTLRDLGEHRLKDLDRPEHVYQLAAPGAPWSLPDDFPPLKSLNNRPNNLPIQRGPLIGRERELQAVRDLLLRGGTGLLTLTGAGGIGKTRLALQVAADLIDDFPDGVFSVSLASTSDPGLVASMTAQTLGVREVPGQDLADNLADYLQDKRMLLVLDNFEQVIEAAPLVARLLAATPGLKALVTSREILRLQNEQEFRVPPLALPDPKRTPSVDTLLQNEAVALFVQRARLVQPNFDVTASNAPTIVEICRRLDGLPLAIELAAARTRLLPPEAMLPRLTSRLKLLTGGARDLPTRQQTLSDTIQWSYDLLTPGEQTLFRRMSVFAGGCTLEAIEAVCDMGDDGRWTMDDTGNRPSTSSSFPGLVHRPLVPLGIDILDGVASLVDKSLLLQEENELASELATPRRGGEPYFVMLQVIREYATELLATINPVEAAEIGKRHATYYLAFVEGARDDLRGPEQRLWLDRLEREHDNLRAVLGWATEREEADIAMRLSWALWWFWQVRGFYSEWRKWAESALAIPGAEPLTPSRARALWGASLMEWLHNNYKSASRYAQESLDIWRELGLENTADYAYALVFRAGPAGFDGDYAAALPAAEQGIALLRKAADRWGLAYGLLVYGLVLNEQGDHAAAKAALTESLELYRGSGNKWGMSQTLNSLGDLARIGDDYKEARRLYGESLDLYRELNNKPDIPASLHNLGYVALALGDVEQAEGLFVEALNLQVEAHNKQGLAECLAGLAGVAAARKQPERAARLFGAAEALREATGLTMWAAERRDYERHYAAARAQLDDTVWEAALAEGRAMTMEQVTAYALEGA